MTLPAYHAPDLFIDGVWRRASGTTNEPVINPATELPLATLHHAGPDDLAEALDAAQRAYPGWKQTPASTRAAILREAARLIHERIDAIAPIVTLEQGKVLAHAKAELQGTADTLHWYAEEGLRAYGRLIPSRSPGSRHIVQRDPIGPVAAFTPWNSPAMTPIRKIGAALAAGCTIILKASEETPATAAAMVQACADAGLPAGVVNLVFGVPSEVSETLIRSDIIRKVSLTGSVGVGKQLAGLAAEGAKPCTMELGGHAPVIVWNDVDPAWAAETSAASKFYNCGQICVSPTRFYVHHTVYESFLETFVAAAERIRPGNGLDAGSDIGPLANHRRLSALQEMVDDARAKGATVHCGGERVGGKGYFFPATVLSDVPEDARIMAEEPFGPIAIINSVKSMDEAIIRANRVSVGLAAYAFTSDVGRATMLADQLASGMVGINTCTISFPETPFGGVKESGYGLEGGVEGLDAYLVSRFVAQASVPEKSLN